MHKVSAYLTKQFLERTYTKQGLSTWEIEKRFGISRSRVYVWLKRHGIPTRTISQSHIRYPRADFDGNNCDKAYLLGFSIGDLRVRNHNGSQSETISIGCGSTKPAQIALVKQLFSRYGRVWVGAPGKRGEVNIEAFVNQSFSFLLPKNREYQWCLYHKTHFFSFLAGFTDAEGSFFIQRNMASIAWGNYNTEILGFIKDGLAKFGIAELMMHCDSLRGTIGKNGYPRNKNYCHLGCARKKVVAALIKELKPFIRHGDKKKALRRLEANIQIRTHAP